MQWRDKPKLNNDSTMHRAVAKQSIHPASSGGASTGAEGLVAQKQEDFKNIKLQFYYRGRGHFSFWKSKIKRRPQLGHLTRSTTCTPRLEPVLGMMTLLRRRTLNVAQRTSGYHHREHLLMFRIEAPRAAPSRNPGRWTCASWNRTPSLIRFHGRRTYAWQR